MMAGWVKRFIAHISYRRRRATLEAFERELNVMMIQAAKEADWATHNLCGKIKEYDLHDLKLYLAIHHDMEVMP